MLAWLKLQPANCGIVIVELSKEDWPQKRRFGRRSNQINLVDVFAGLMKVRLGKNSSHNFRFNNAHSRMIVDFALDK